MSFMIGQAVKGLATAAMATYFYLYQLDPKTYVVASWIPMVVFIFEFVVRGTIIINVLYALVGELYPTEIRTLAVGINQFCQYLTGALVIKLYPDMKSSMTIYGLCYFYTCVIIVNIIWAYFTIPDNRSKSLIEVEESFETKKSDKVELLPNNIQDKRPTDITPLRK